jgi:SNF2 family DNA or RNA helicase
MMLTSHAKPVTSSSLTSNKLFMLYKKQSRSYQQIVQLRALLHFMPDTQTFMTVLVTSSLRTEQGKKFTVANLKIIFAQLRAKGLFTRGFNCPSKILHLITCETISENNPHRTELFLAIKNFFEHPHEGYYINKNEHTFMGKLCAVYLSVYLNDSKSFLSTEQKQPSHAAQSIDYLIHIFYSRALDANWVKTRHPTVQLYLLCTKLYSFYTHADESPPDLNHWILFIQQNDCIKMAIEHNLHHIPLLMSRLLQLSFLFKKTSSLKESQQLFLSDTMYYYHELQAGLAFFNADSVNAITHYQKASQLFTAINMKKNEWPVANLHPFLYVLACLHDSSSENIKAIYSFITSIQKSYSDQPLPYFLHTFLELHQNNPINAREHYKTAVMKLQRATTPSPTLHALADWCTLLLNPEKIATLLPTYQQQFKQYRDMSCYLLAQIYAELIQSHDDNNEEVDYFLNTLSPLGHFRFMNILRIKQPWEYAITQLHQLLAVPDHNSATQYLQADRRMIWLIDPKKCEINVSEQSLRKTGTWSMGRAIALKRLFQNDPTLDYLTPYDKKALGGLCMELLGWYQKENFYWDVKKTLKALIGHPMVFHMENRDIPIHLVEGCVKLQIEKVDKGYHFSLSAYSTTPKVFLQKETTNQYQVIDFSEENVAIANILSEKGMTVPLQAKEKVTEMICNAKSTIQIQSDIDDDNLPSIPGDATPCVHLLPIGDGIKLNVWIKPCGETGAYCKAAEGQPNIITTLKTDEQQEIKQKFVRDFVAEKNNIDALMTQCPSLIADNKNTDEWYFDTVENSLELLMELEEYKKNNPLVIEWPKGQTLKVKHSISSKNLSLSIKGSGYWFKYEGDVQIDESSSLEIKKLLDLLDHSQGRFIPLATGEFIALTEKFKKQLDNLRTLSHKNQIYHLSTTTLQELADDAGSFQQDQTWTEHLNKLTAMAQYKPVVPSTLQAQLRDYQVEGFSYLSRLSHWEIGACLADDMGLGKTVQAIALLLSNAAKGPSLVVAPTSVCFVWLEELSKFAPTLRPHTLHSESDRTTLIDSLKAMDILICSYGLLHQVGASLTEKEWQFVILDEAQAIKNSATKRWKYATQLKSRCRVALTGTPIENHLGELWSIFHFLNPGLLGTQPYFQQKFSGPIERYQDPTAKTALKTLVSPYILRRIKSDVLRELPPKIEQSVLIEPSLEEIAFYDAVRKKALERIDSLNGAENENAKRFGILAEITRLRQACCDARLVDENITITNSKIKTFLALVNNIIENNHRALIFSQFVRYLTIIKNVLDQEKIHYQYIDGSTPMQRRKQAVKDFQAGQGELFLISLKAGGTGLNLTAADYVIILDPWWNPAVEDQAADRAHRIGQQQPVTVYRLVMKNTIEEKIITLHQDKKDLATDLLSGSEMTGKMSSETLLGLITS